MDDQRTQPRPERRARREPLRHRGDDTLAAARADAAMAVDARDHRADRRQVDVVIGMNVRLVGRCERMGAVWTGRKCRLDYAVGVFSQCASDTGALPALHLQAVGTVRLLAFRRRQAGIVRRLGWGSELGLQVCHPCRQRADLRRLHKDQGNQVILRKGKKSVAIHADGEANRPSSVNPAVTVRGANPTGGR